MTILEILEPRWYMMAMLGPASTSNLPGLNSPEIYDGHTAINRGVLNVWAPNPSDIGGTWTPDLRDPSAALFGSDGVPGLSAIKQGPIGDCYLIAAVGGEALQHPVSLRSLIWWDGQGFAMEWHSLSGSDTVVHTQPSFSTAYQANTGEVYWEVAEKTYAYLRTTANTFSSLDLGFVTLVALQLGEPIVSQPAVRLGDTATYRNDIVNALAMGKPVYIITNPDAPTMVQSHVYVVTAVQSNGLVMTYNPWGFYDLRSVDDLMANGSVVIAG